MLVTFSGIDGSGKSTYSGRLAKELSSLGIASAATRPAYKGNKIVKKYCLHRYGDEYAYYPNLSSNFYLSVLALDWIDWLHDYLLPQLNKQVHCCDRYIIDVYSQAIQYGANIDFLQELFEPFPTPDLSFYLDVEPVEAVKRIQERTELPQHSLESLSELERLTTSFQQVEAMMNWNFVKLDAKNSIHDNLAMIIKKIEELR